MEMGREKDKGDRPSPEGREKIQPSAGLRGEMKLRQGQIQAPSSLDQCRSLQKSPIPKSEEHTEGQNESVWEAVGYTQAFALRISPNLRTDVRDEFKDENNNESLL